MADALGIKRANFVTLFDALIARDLAYRAPVAHDRRSVTLHLTMAGETLVGEMLMLGAVHEGYVTARIGAEGRAVLLPLLHRLAGLD